MVLGHGCGCIVSAALHPSGVAPSSPLLPPLPPSSSPSLLLPPRRRRRSSSSRSHLPHKPRALHDSSTSESFGDTKNQNTAKNDGWAQGKDGAAEPNDALWDQIAVNFRIAYVAGIYGAMVLVGQTVCNLIGTDRIGGFDMSAVVAMEGLGYSIPPVIALLFILDDGVVKKCLHARAIRDAEDEELMSFFVGLSPCQVMFVVSLSAIAEELFFRVAVQGGLAHFFLSDEKFKQPVDGIAALTGVFPSLAPFAHALAAVLTAALTGSILFISSFPKDPQYIITPVLRNRTSLTELKKSFAAWYERRQLRRIYSPLLESLLALYLGFEWMQTGNILAPIITHVIYSNVIVGNGVRKIHAQRDRLRQRTQNVSEKNLPVSDYQSGQL